MEKETTSFWADIKKYEDILAKDPRSYCFAPLSELYRKLGLLDDALAVAKRGTEAHPEYIGGYMAFGRALFEMGKREEAKASLEKVALATPENLLAQKLLSQIYQEEGNLTAAEKALRILVAFNPEDSESAISLEVLQRSMQQGDDKLESASAETVVDSGVTIDEPAPAVTLSLDEVAQPLVSDDTVNQEWADFPQITEESEDVSRSAPLPTLTLAELYEAQSLYEKARDVYRDLLDKDPDNELLQERLSAVELRLESETVSVPLPVEERVAQMEVSEEYPDQGIQSLDPGCDEAEPDIEKSREEHVLEILEIWLNAVRRRMECR